MITAFAPETVHAPLLEAAKPELTFDRADDLDRWRAALAARAAWARTR